MRTGHQFIIEMHSIDERSPTATVAAGTIISAHDQVRLKARCTYPFNFHAEQSAALFCIQDTISLGTCILATSFSCNTSSPTCLHMAPLDMVCKGMNCQGMYFSYLRTLACVNLGCVKQSPSAALATTHLTLAL